MKRLICVIVILLLALGFCNDCYAKEIIIKAVNESEYELLANLINAECGQSDYVGDDMCYAVGSVVLNRVKHKDFPDTIYGVIYQQGQYACVYDGNMNKPVNDRSYRIAYDLLSNGSTLPDNVVWQAEFTQGNGVYEQIDNMIFCYE